jgi:hypothetical protein
MRIIYETLYCIVCVILEEPFYLISIVHALATKYIFLLACLPGIINK